jgi:hypothetical protein
MTTAPSFDRLTQRAFASPGRLRGVYRRRAGCCTSRSFQCARQARSIRVETGPTSRPLLATRALLGDNVIGELTRRRAERFRFRRTETPGRTGGLSFNAMNTPSIGAPSTDAGRTLSRRGCLRNRHSQNQRRKRGPAARTVALAFAPALNLIVAPTTAVTIGWKVREPCVRIGPAVAVNPGVSPGEARRSRRSSCTGKSSAGNHHRHVISDVPHGVDPLRKSRRTESII